jgi:hypothetical protein
MKATTKFLQKKQFFSQTYRRKKNDIFVRVKNNIINKKIIKNVTTTNNVFVSRFLKLRIAFLMLQKND